MDAVLSFAVPADQPSQGDAQNFKTITIGKWRIKFPQSRRINNELSVRVLTWKQDKFSFRFEDNVLN